MKHETWMGIAKLIAENESKCISHKVGAVIVKDDRIVSTGYNGTPTKQPNCCDVNNHLVHNGEFQNYISEDAKVEHHEWSIKNELHAEHNAIMFASPEDRKGSTLYCTLQPCQQCSVLIAGSGIKTIIYEKEYPRTPLDSYVVLIRAGIEVYKLSDLKKEP